MVDPGGFRTTPASLTTFVEGVHSSDPETWQRAVDRGRNLAKASGGPAVVWLGYQAPSSLPRAVHATPARTASQELARFQRSLGRRYPQAKRTVVGYSYGSVVTGHAAKQERIAEDVVLVGSPGTGAGHASELHGRIWAATNANDPIAITTGPHAGIHGPDPTIDTFGATPLPGADLGAGTDFRDQTRAAGAKKKKPSGPAPWQAVATPDTIPEPNPDADPEGALYGQHVTLTGDFDPFDKGVLWQGIAERGGQVAKNVTKKSTLLIVGEWAKKTSKEKRAEELQASLGLVTAPIGS